MVFYKENDLALSPTQEAQVLQLVAEQAALLSLANNEATIISKLGATKVNLSSLGFAVTFDDADIMLIRQGTTDLSIAGSVVKAAVAVPDATDTIKGKSSLAVAANYPSVSDTESATPAYVSSAVAAAPSVTGLFSNLKASATGLSAVVTITADELIVKNGTSYKTLTSVSVTPSLAASGVNGLDTGASAINTWYAAFVIWNPTTLAIAGLLSLSATAPTMPSGYTHKARIGWVRSDGTANKYPLSFTQKGKSVTPLLGSANLAAPLLLSSGTVGTFNSSTYTPVAVAWANFIPPTSSKIRVGMSANVTSVFIGISSNASRSGYATSNPPELGFNSSAYPSITYGDLLIETSNIYWASNGGTGYLIAGGWEDNL